MTFEHIAVVHVPDKKRVTGTPTKNQVGAMLAKQEQWKKPHKRKLLATPSVSTLHPFLIIKGEKLQ